MDEWRLQQQHRMASGGIGPVLSYHSIRTRPSPYPMAELKQAYPYSQNSSTNPLSPSSISSTTTSTTNPNPNPASTPIPVNNDPNDVTSSSLDDISNTTPNADVYTPNNNNPVYNPVQLEQMQQQQQQQMMSVKSAPGPMVGYHPGQQQMMAARSRPMPYPMPPPPSHHPHGMYSHPSGPVCQCAHHMAGNHNHYPVPPSNHPMYYQQQSQEAWYRYQQQQQQQQAAWRQHQMQQQQQHIPASHQPVPIEQNYHPILSENTSTTKSKSNKNKSKKKSATSINEDVPVKYQTIPPSSLNLRVSQQQQQILPHRTCVPSASTAYYPSVYPTPNLYQPAQQLTPTYPTLSSQSQENPMNAQTSPSTLSHHQSQLFTSPLSNPGTPHQMHSNGEFNGTAEFGVPYHHGAPGSVNSLTDALCPGGDSTDRNMTPGPPSVGTPRVVNHQYPFPHTPLTPQTMSNQGTNPHTPIMLPPTPNPLSAPPTPLTRPRSLSEQISSMNNAYQNYDQPRTMSNVDDLAAYLKDPANVYLTDDGTSTLLDDIDALADAYLGQQSTSQQNTNVDNNSADDILLNFLCSDDVTN